MVVDAGINRLGVGVVITMRTRGWALQAVLMLGCRSGEIEEREPSVPLEPSVVLEAEPAEQPKPAEIEPPEPEPEPEPRPDPPLTWRPVAAPTFIEAKELRRTATTARHALEDQQLRYRLDLRMRERSTKVTLTDRDSGHKLAVESSRLSCDHEYTWIGASLGELAHDARGRKLLDFWVACTLGEDILFTDALRLIVLVDAEGLTTLWSGIANAHTSHVCGDWDAIEVSVGREELIVTSSDVSMIFLPEEIPGYDCDESSREYVLVREQHRVQLPR